MSVFSNLALLKISDKILIEVSVLDLDLTICPCQGLTPLLISDYSETDHSEEKEGDKSCSIKKWNLEAETLLCVPPVTWGRINLT